MPSRSARGIALRITVSLSVATATLITAGIGSRAHADGTLAVGIPTMVDPIRAAGEPYIGVDNTNNALITGPAGSGAQTSWFWKSGDGNLSYQVLGPGNGHWVCPASGGGDSLVVFDRQNNDAYLDDQEALANVGFGKLKADGTFTSGCAKTPAMTADRPFNTVLHPGASLTSVAPQYTADGSKPINYLSWQCNACGGSGSPGGLAYGWSDDGVNFHPADPGVADGNLATQQFNEANSAHPYQWHGNMVADPRTGYVFTAISCGPNGCPNGGTTPEFGVMLGKPLTSFPAGSNIGSFSSLTYQTAATTEPDGTPLNTIGNLFPVIAMDSNYTLYEAWVEGDGSASTSATPAATNWHVYYTYSLDTPSHDHTVWSTPHQVDILGTPATGTNIMTWVAAGDAGNLGFIWMSTPVREHPSKANTSKLWNPWMATVQHADTTTPVIQATQVGSGPNHVGDVCLQGTVGCITSVGNRNMADFISCDIGPDGVLQGTWANDANQLATSPATLVPGAPVTESAREVSGPRLIGGGNVSDTRFSTTPTTAGITDATGDAIFNGVNQPNLDLTASQVGLSGGNVTVHLAASDLTSLASPDLTHPHVWWLTVWQFNHKLYFARAEYDGVGTTPTFFAGPAKSFDRVGLNGQTAATLVDYSGGTAVTGQQNGNAFDITVPTSVVGNPPSGSVFEVTTAYTMLDNGAPLAIGPGSGNIPIIVDATPAYNALAGSASVPEAPLTVVLVVVGMAAIGAAGVLRRRRVTA